MGEQDPRIIAAAAEIVRLREEAENGSRAAVDVLTQTQSILWKFAGEDWSLRDTILIEVLHRDDQQVAASYVAVEGTGHSRLQVAPQMSADAAGYDPSPNA